MKDHELLLNTAMLAGELLLRSGAETFRVEDTMRRMLSTAENFRSLDIYVVMTGITASIDVYGELPLTLVRRTGPMSTNLNNIVEINAISREYCSGKLTLHETYAKLNSLNHHVYTNRESILGIVMICMGFSIFFGGTIPDIIAASLIGFIIYLSKYMFSKFNLHSFMNDMIAAFFVSITALILNKIFHNISISTVIISAIMPLVPGVAITNAARDTLQGDYLSGTARVMEAFMTAVGIAIGIGGGFAVINLLF